MRTIVEDFRSEIAVSVIIEISVELLVIHLSGDHAQVLNLPYPSGGGNKGEQATAGRNLFALADETQYSKVGGHLDTVHVEQIAALGGDHVNNPASFPLSLRHCLLTEAVGGKLRERQN